CQPRNEPTAPISFQSPAPNARRWTSGKSNRRARPMPANANQAPCQPPRTACIVIPETAPGIVSQLGILLERQSQAAARQVNSNVSVQIAERGSIRVYISVLLSRLDSLLMPKLSH